MVGIIRFVGTINLEVTEHHLTGTSPRRIRGDVAYIALTRLRTREHDDAEND